MDPLTLACIVAACLLLSAFFSSSETALMRLSRGALEAEAKESRGLQALAARDLVRHSSRLLVTILFGNNIVNILGAAAAAALAISWFGEERGIAVSTAAMTLLVLVFCEVLPKAMAARHPRKIGLFVALPVYALHQLLRPLHVVFDRVIEPLARRIGAGEAGEAQLRGEALLHMARANREENGAAAKAGAEADATTPLAIIGAAAGAADMTVEEIMVPRTEIIAFPVDTPPAELLERVLGERYTRVPLYGDSIDDVRGVCHLKDLIELVRNGEANAAGAKPGLRGLLKPVLRVPERKPILELLAEMQRAFAHMAVVKDEFGVTLGLCTHEDVLEEIVGEIRDEFDREELQMIRKTGGGGYEALGRIKVRDFNRASGWEIPAERGDTLGGLVFNTLGHAPMQGERVEIAPFAFTVAGVSGSRITRIRITRSESTAAEDESTSAPESESQKESETGEQ